MVLHILMPWCEHERGKSINISHQSNIVSSSFLRKIMICFANNQSDRREIISLGIFFASNPIFQLYLVVRNVTMYVLSFRENGKSLNLNCHSLIFCSLIVAQTSLNSQKCKYGLFLPIPWNLSQSCTAPDFISKCYIFKEK